MPKSKYIAAKGKEALTFNLNAGKGTAKKVLGKKAF